MVLSFLYVWGIFAVIFVCIAGTAKLDEALLANEEVEERSRLIVMSVAWPLCLAIVIMFALMGSASIGLRKAFNAMHKDTQSTERLN